MSHQNLIRRWVLGGLLILLGLPYQTKGIALQIHNCPSASLLVGNSKTDYRGVEFVPTGGIFSPFKGNETLHEMSYEKSHQGSYYIACVYEGPSGDQKTIVGVLPGQGPYHICSKIEGNSVFTVHPEKSVSRSSYSEEEFRSFVIMEQPS